MTRENQLNYSSLKPSVFNSKIRVKKAQTIVRVCQDFLQTEDLSGLTLLDVGSSSGIIDNFLADYFGRVHGIDIDEPAMEHATNTFNKPNLFFAHDFSGNNRVMYMEPHYKLPFLSLLPRFLAHYYMRMMGKGSHYHEKHVGYWSLIRLCSAFKRVDYSEMIIADPVLFGTEYMLRPGSIKHRVAKFIARYIKWATPHIWILEKESSVPDGTANVDIAR
jgi:hypothetical protein